jgi:hypothetical protein
LAIDERIIDHRRKEVDGLDDGQIIGEPIDTGIVMRLGADEKVRVFVGG